MPHLCLHLCLPLRPQMRTKYVQIRTQMNPDVPNLRKIVIFPKWACPQIPEMLIFQKQKPLRGASSHRGAFENIPPEN